MFSGYVRLFLAKNSLEVSEIKTTENLWLQANFPDVITARVLSKSYFILYFVKINSRIFFFPDYSRLVDDYIN